MAAPIGPVRLYRSKYGRPTAPPVAPPSTSPAPVRYYQPKYASPVAPRVAPPLIAQTPEEALSSRSWGETAVDTGIRAARQAGGLAQAGLSIFGAPEELSAPESVGTSPGEMLESGVRSGLETVSGIGIPRIARAANAAIGSGLEALGEYTSPGRRRADELFSQIDAEQKAALPATEASAPIPASHGRFGPHQGEGYDPAAVARAAQRAEQEAKLTFRKIGADPAGMVGDIAGNAVPFMAAGRLGRVAGISEEVMAPLFSVPLEAGSVKQNIAQTVMDEPHENLMTDPKYAAEVDVFGKEVARKRLADRAQSYLENPGLIALGAAEGYILSKLGADAALMRAGSGAVKRGAAGSILKNTLVQGAKETGTEIPQEMFTTAAGNIGAASGGANIDPMKGVVESGIMAGFTAGPAGAAAGGVDAFKAEREQAGEGQASPGGEQDLAEDEFTQTAAPKGQEPHLRGAAPIQSRGEEPFGAPIAPIRPKPAFDPTNAQIVLEAEILGGDGLAALKATGMSDKRAKIELERVRAVLGPKAPPAKGVDRAEDKKAAQRRAQAESEAQPSPADEIASFDADPLANAPKRREGTPEELAAYMEDAQRGISTAEDESTLAGQMERARSEAQANLENQAYSSLLARPAAAPSQDVTAARSEAQRNLEEQWAREHADQLAVAEAGGPAFYVPKLIAAAVKADSIKPLVDSGVPGSPSQLRKMLEKAKASPRTKNVEISDNRGSIAPGGLVPDVIPPPGIGISSDRGQLGEVGQEANGIAKGVNPVGRPEEARPASQALPGVDRPALIGPDAGTSVDGKAVSRLGDEGRDGGEVHGESVRPNVSQETQALYDDIATRIEEIQRAEPNLPHRVIAQRVNKEFGTDNRLGRGREALGRRIVDEILKGQENPKTTDRGNYPGGPVSAMLNSRKDTGPENDPERALYEAMDRKDRQQQHIAESVAAKEKKDAANLSEQEALPQRLEESVRNTRREGVQGQPAVAAANEGALSEVSSADRVAEQRSGTVGEETVREGRDAGETGRNQGRKTGEFVADEAPKAVEAHATTLAERLEALRPPRLTHEELNNPTDEVRSREATAHAKARAEARKASDQELQDAMGVEGRNAIVDGKPPSPTFSNGARNYAAEEWNRRNAVEAHAESVPPKSQETKHEFSSTQANLPEAQASAIQNLGRTIRKADLAEEGVVTDPHVTVKYGTHTNDVEALRKILSDEGPIKITFGDLSTFPPSDSSNGAEVLKIDVESLDLQRLNKKISDALPHTDTFKYAPHVTVAYVKPGTAKKYVGQLHPFKGKSMTLSSLTFSDKNGEQHEIPLTGKPQEAATVPVERPKAAAKRLSDEARREELKQEIRKVYGAMGGKDFSYLDALNTGELEDALARADENPARTDEPVERPKPEPRPARTDQMGTPRPKPEPVKDSNFESFTAAMTPMQKGKTRAALAQDVLNNGKPISRAALVERKVSEGATVTRHEVKDATAKKKLQAEYERLRRTAPIGNERHPDTIRLNELSVKLAPTNGDLTKDQRRLSNPDRSFLSDDQIGKTAMDYAEFLIAKRDGKSAAELTDERLKSQAEYWLKEKSPAPAPAEKPAPKGMDGLTRAERAAKDKPAKPEPAPEAPLPPKSIEKLQKAIADVNVAGLRELLHPMNKRLRAMFTEATGLALPKGVKDTWEFLGNTQTRVDIFAKKTVSDRFFYQQTESGRLHELRVKIAGPKPSATSNPGAFDTWSKRVNYLDTLGEQALEKELEKKDAARGGPPISSDTTPENDAVTRILGVSHLVKFTPEDLKERIAGYTTKIEEADTNIDAGGQRLTQITDRAERKKIEKRIGELRDEREVARKMMKRTKFALSVYEGDPAQKLIAMAGTFDAVDKKKMTEIVTEAVEATPAAKDLTKTERDDVIKKLADGELSFSYYSQMADAGLQETIDSAIKYVAVSRAEAAARKKLDTMEGLEHQTGYKEQGKPGYLRDLKNASTVERIEEIVKEFEAANEVGLERKRFNDRKDAEDRELARQKAESLKAPLPKPIVFLIEALTTGEYAALTTEMAADGEGTTATDATMERLRKRGLVEPNKFTFTEEGKKFAAQVQRYDERLKFGVPISERVPTKGRFTDATAADTEMIAGQFEGRDIHSDGHWLVEGKLPEKRNGKPIPLSERFKDTGKLFDSTMNPKKGVGEKVHPVAFYKHEVSSKFAKADDDFVVLSNGAIYNGTYLDYVQALHPESEMFSRGVDDPVYFKKDGRIVGVVMPVRGPAPDGALAIVEQSSKPSRTLGDQVEEPLTKVEKAKEPPRAISDVGEKLGGARKDLSTKTGPRPESAADDRSVWEKRFTVSQTISSSDPTEKGKWNVSDSKKSDRFNYKPLGTFDTKEAAEAFVPIAAVADSHRVYKGNDGRFKIERKIGDRKLVQVVKETFETREDAMAYMAAHAEEILGVKTNFGEEVLPRPDPNNVQRIGAARREGDVNENHFKDTFGFRGVEFGNWNAQDERQTVMNHAYDSLLDLAETLGIPPKAISLEGELGLGFGSRGHGLTGARAHYERDYGVINLTKMKGAGALAHEWFHSLDHYFGRQRAADPNERTVNKRGDKVFKESSMVTEGGYTKGVREEVAAKVKTLVSTMKDKAEKFVEDTQKVERWVGQTRDDVKQKLADIRRNLAAPESYTKKPAATAEQLARFDALAEQLINGEAITLEWKDDSKPPVKKNWYSAMTRGRYTNAALDELSDILKKVRGRSGFAKETGALTQLAPYLKRYSERIEQAKSASTGEEKTRSIPTQFAMNARSADQGRASAYWSTPVEMAARAFQSYVEDRLSNEGAQNDFLTFGTKNAVIETPWGLVRPYPLGDERTALNAAFDDLFKTVQTKETDKGVAMFDRPNEQTTEEAWQHYDSKDGEKTTLSPTAYRDGGRIVGAPPDVRVVDFMGDVDKSVLTDMAKSRASLAHYVALAERQIQRAVPGFKFGGFTPSGNLHGVNFQDRVFLNDLATHQIALEIVAAERITYPEAYARAMWDVISHEGAHYAEKGHGVEFLAELARIETEVGPQAIRAIKRDFMRYASEEKHRTQTQKMYEKALPGWREGERRGREAAARAETRSGGLRTRPDVATGFQPRPRGDTSDSEGVRGEGNEPQGSLFAPDRDAAEGLAAPAFVRGTDGRVAFSRKPPAPPEKLSIAAEGVLNDLAKRIRDVFTPVKVAQEAVEKKLGKRWNLRLDRQLTGIPARADHTMGQAESLFLNPLMEVVRTKGLDFDLAGEYAQAVYDDGMPQEKRASIMEKAKGKRADYEEVRKRILDVQRIADDYKVKMGLATPEEIADLRDERGDGYVSTREHPLIAAIQDLEKTVIQAERNRTLNDLAEFVEAADQEELGTVSEGFEDGGVHFRRDGEPMTINLPDKGLRAAMDGLSDTQLDNLTQTVGALTRWTSRVNTQLSPVFPIRNTGRDWGGAILFATILHGAPNGITKSVAWEVMKNEFKAMRGVIDYLKAPEKKHPEGSWAAKVSEASRYGAVPGYLKQMSSIGKIRSQLEEALKSKLSVREHLKVNATEARAALGDKSLDSIGRSAKIASLGTDAASRAAGFRAFSDFMGWLSNVSEMATRANYNAALVKNGTNPQVAADETRDLIDFNRKGLWTRWMQAFLPFINPNIQGTARILDMVTSKDPAVKARAAKTIAALAAAGFAYGMAMAAMGGDEDKDGIPDMDQLPDYQSSRNLVLPAVGNFSPLLLPLPPGFNVPFFAGFMASRIARGTIKPGKAIASIAAQFSEAFTPVDSPFGVFKPLSEIAYNKKFGGGPVAPINYSEHRPDSTLAFKNTRTPYKAAAEGLNRLTGGDEVTKGAIDVSPDTLEHLGEALLGGTGRFFTRSADSVEALAKGQVPNYIPVYSDLTVDVERQRQGRFYDQVRQIEETDFKRRGKEKSALVKELAERHPGVDFTRGTLPQLRKALQGQAVSPERREWFLKEMERIDGAALRAKPTFDDAEKALKNIEKTMRDGPEKDAARRDVYLRANRAYQEALK